LQHLEVGSIMAEPLARQSLETLRQLAFHLCVLLHSRQLTCGPETQLRLAIVLIQMLPIRHQPTCPSLGLLRDPLTVLADTYQVLVPRSMLQELNPPEEIPLFQEQGLNGVQSVKRALECFLAQRMEAVHGNLVTVRSALESGSTNNRAVLTPRLESREVRTPQPPSTPRHASGHTRRSRLATSTTDTKPHDWVL
jgi:hypothetical protein